LSELTFDLTGSSLDANDVMWTLTNTAASASVSGSIGSQTVSFSLSYDISDNDFVDFELRGQLVANPTQTLDNLNIRAALSLGGVVQPMSGTSGLDPMTSAVQDLPGRTIEVMASQLSVIGMAPSSAMVNQTIALTLWATDSDGNIDVDWMTPVNVSWTGAGTPTPASLNPSSGVADFAMANLSISEPGDLGGTLGFVSGALPPLTITPFNLIDNDDEDSQVGGPSALNPTLANGVFSSIISFEVGDTGRSDGKPTQITSMVVDAAVNAPHKLSDFEWQLNTPAGIQSVTSVDDMAGTLSFSFGTLPTISESTASTFNLQARITANNSATVDGTAFNFSFGVNPSSVTTTTMTSTSISPTSGFSMVNSTATLDIVATTHNLLTALPSTLITNKAYDLEFEFVDAMGNRDLGVNSSVGFSRSDAGSIVPSATGAVMGVVSLTGMAGVSMPLPENAALTINVTTSAIGNFSFGPFNLVAPPVLQSSNPGIHAHNISTLGNLSATFDKPLSAASLADGIRIHGPRGRLQVPSAVTVSGQGNTIVATPSGALASGALYQVSITPTLTGQNTAPIQQPFVWQYRTQTAEASGVLDAFHQTLGSGVGVVDVFAGDFDNDGYVDVFVAVNGGQSLIYKGDANGSFSSTINVGPASQPVSRAHVFDADNNGSLDIFLFDTAIVSPVHKLLLNSGSGSFTTINSPLGLNATPDASNVADLDGDGYMDVALITSSLLHVYRGSALGFLPNLVNINTGSGDAKAINFADLDKNGTLDVIITKAGAQHAIIYNHGALHQQTSTFIPFGNPAGGYGRTIGVGDFNGDNNVDILMPDDGNQANIYYGDGMGGLGAPMMLGAAANDVQVGDINGDGHLDILLTRGNTFANDVYLGSMTGFMSTTTPPGAASDHTSAALLFDLDGDGDLDAVTANTNGNVRAFFNEMPETLTFVGPATLPTMMVGENLAGVQLMAMGGVAPYTFMELSTLPAGLTLSPEGVLSGTPSIGSEATYNIMVQVMDSYLGSVSGVVNLTIVPVLAFNNGGMSTLTLPQGTEGSPYLNMDNSAITLSASGGNNPLTYVAGDLMQWQGLGLSVNTINGVAVISGSPTIGSEGNHTLTLKAIDQQEREVTQTLSLTIKPFFNPAAPHIEMRISNNQQSNLGATPNTTNLPIAVFDIEAKFAAASIGGLTVQLSGPTSSLARLRLFNDVNRNGIRDNNDTQLGTEHLSIGTSASFSFAPVNLNSGQTISLVLVAATGNSVLSGTSIQASIDSASALVSLIPNGAMEPRVVAGQFPLLGTTLTLAQTLALPSIQSISMTAENAPQAATGLIADVNILNSGGHGIEVLSLQLTLRQQGQTPLVITPTSILPALGTLNGGATYNGSLTFDLPASLLPGSYTLDARVSARDIPSNATVNDNDSALTDSLLVYGPLMITTQDLPILTVGTAFQRVFQASGGLLQYTFSALPGEVPAGMTFTNGVLQGIPSSAGSTNMTITVMDSMQSVNRAYSLTVQAPPAGSTTSPNQSVGGVSILTSQLGEARQNVAFMAELKGSAINPRWSMVANQSDLPNGFTLSTTGVLSGTTAESGSFIFVARLDGTGGFAQKQFVLQVQATTVQAPQLNAGSASGLNLRTIGAAISGANGMGAQPMPVNGNPTLDFIDIDSSDMVGPSIVAAYYIDTNGDSQVDAGDRVQINFDERLKTNTINIADLLLGGLDSFGLNATAGAGSLPATIEVTLGSAPVLSVGTSTIAISGGATLRDLAGNAPVSSSATIQSGSTIASAVFLLTMNGETLSEGTPASILWSAQPVNADWSFTLRLLQNGSPVQTIASGLSNTTSFTWSVPQGIAGEGYTIELEGYNADRDETVSTHSASSFRIVGFGQGDGASFINSTAFLNPSVASINESGSVVVQVKLTAPGGMTEEAVSVTIADSGNGTATANSDYSFMPTTLTFPRGSLDGAIMSATLNVIDDSIVEGNETVILALESPSTPSIVGFPGLITVTITDDEFAAPLLEVRDLESNTLLAHNATLDLGNNVELEAARCLRKIEIRNAGNATMSLNSLATMGAPNFSFSGTLPTTLAAQSALTLTVALTPSGLGNFTGSLGFNHSNGAYLLNLTGIGMPLMSTEST
ncbi:MAG: VCBS repeat-containing protein, partial [Planctomycetes bacterium]|nr:VCBS repeat-containing protein [Planctomycetota bacterium]